MCKIPLQLCFNVWDCSRRAYLKRNRDLGLLSVSYMGHGTERPGTSSWKWKPLWSVNRKMSDSTKKQKSTSLPKRSTVPFYYTRHTGSHLDFYLSPSWVLICDVALMGVFCDTNQLTTSWNITIEATWMRRLTWIRNGWHKFGHNFHFFPNSISWIILLHSTKGFLQCHLVNNQMKHYFYC